MQKWKNVLVIGLKGLIYNSIEMKWKYLVIEICGEIFVMNDNDELGGLIDNDVLFMVIGYVCIEECNIICLYYC